MASKEDLSDQLGLTTKLAAQVERMAKAADEVSNAYQTQIAAIQQLTSALGQINTDGLVAGMSVINKALVELQTKMKDTGKTSETTFQKLGKKVEETGKTIANKFPKSVAIGTAALSGFMQGIRNIIALGKGLTGFFTSFVSGAASIATSILAIPFKMFHGLVDLAAKNAGGMSELAQAIEDLRKQFGAMSGPTNKAIISTSKNLEGFSATGLSAWRVFGTMAERLNYIRELATEMGGAFGKLSKEMENNGGAILAYQKGLGIASEDMKGITQRAVAMGTKTSDQLKDMTKYSYALGDAFGLDAKLISRDMSKAMTDVAHFGGATVKQIAEASTYARKLGFELKDITGTLDKFDTFDSAAENAAKLSQAFGVNIDAFELMKAQSPAEQIDLLRKSFKAAGVDASKFDRASLKLAATTTGLNENIVQSAFSLKNQGKSLDEIKKKGGEAQQKTMTQEQAMGKLADAIERMVKAGGGLHGGFWDNFIEGIGRGIMSSKEFWGLMRNIQMALRAVLMEGVKLGRQLVKTFPGLQDILGGLKDFFEPKKFREMFANVSKAVEDFISGPDKGSMEKLFEKLKKTVTDMFTKEGTSGKKIVDGFKKLFEFLSEIASKAIVWLADKMKDGMVLVTELLSGKKKLGMAGAGAAAEGGLGFLGKILMPIVDALKNAWTIIKDPLWELVKTIGQKLKAFLTSKEFISFVSPAFPVLAGMLFGPALTRGLIGGLTSSLVKSVISGGGKSIITKAVGGVAEKLAGSGLGGAAGLAGPAAIVAAAAAIGSGVEKYTDKITGTMDRSSAKIAAGATGLIDALTLGLLPKGIDLMIANTLSKLVDMIFNGISSVFGKGFGDSIKRQLANTFAIFGSLWGLIKNLFTGDQASVNDSMKELGLAVLRFLVSALNYSLIQLPLFLGKLSVTILTAVGNLVISLIGALATAIAAGLDKVFGTHMAEKVVGLSDDLKKLMDKKSAELSQGMTNVSNAVSKASDKLQDEYLTSQAEKSKEVARKAAAAAAGAAAPMNDAAKAAAADTQKSVSSISESISQVKAVKKQLEDKDFDIAGAIKFIKEKVKDVDFGFLGTAQMKALQDTSDGMMKLSGFAQNLVNSSNSLKAAGKVLGETKNAALGAAVTAVSEMVKQANALNDALGDGGVNKIDIKAKLDNVAKAVGLGGKASYTVNPSKEVQITVNMTVTMDAGTVEKVILQREGSILRDRINFATGSPTQALPSPIPNNTREVTAPAPTPGGTKT